MSHAADASTESWRIRETYLAHLLEPALHTSSTDSLASRARDRSRGPELAGRVGYWISRGRLDEVEPPGVSSGTVPSSERSDFTAATALEAAVELTAARALDRSLIARHLGALFEIARDERFEDGMDSNLSVGIRILFRDYSSDFVPVLEKHLKTSEIGALILEEVLYTLGQIRDDATKDWRLATLVDFLKAALPSVRDAAAVGLAYLDDKRAIAYLGQAIARETSETLREDFRAVVEQLAG